MKLFIILLLCFLVDHLQAQNDVYGIKIPSLDSTAIRLSDYKGKKILIAVVSPSKLLGQKLTSLEKLLDEYPSLVVLAIPSTEFGDQADRDNLTKVRVNRTKRVIVGSSSTVRKAARTNQNALLKWLTDVSENTHFDADISSDEQIYIINETGELYALLENGASSKVIRTALDLRK